MYLYAQQNATAVQVGIFVKRVCGRKVTNKHLELVNTHIQEHLLVSILIVFGRVAYVRPARS